MRLPNHTTSNSDEVPHIAEIAEVKDSSAEIIETYAVKDPYSYVRIIYYNDSNEYLLEIIEPHLGSEERTLLALVKDSLHKILDYEQDALNIMSAEEYLLKGIETFIMSRGYKIDSISKKRIGYYLLRDFTGYGKVDALMHDENIEDISCDGVGIPLFVYHSKYGSIKTTLVFDYEEELNSYIVALGQRGGRQISVSNPILDGTVPEGHRIQATYAREVTTRGSTFTVRRFRNNPFTPIQLIKNGTASPEMIAYFWLGVENGESMIISGGTASGKTSTLNSLALFIPPQMKIVSIEDTREIRLPHQNWIPSTTRSGIREQMHDGKFLGEIDMYDLMRAALRQRPQYLIVGEVRGRETYSMFQAMATGHATYSTMHADSMQSMVNRLENEPINCPRILLTSLQNVIFQSQVRIDDRFVRRMNKVIEVVGFDPDTNELISNSVFDWERSKDRFVYKGHSFLFDRIMEMRSLSYKDMMNEFDRRVDIIRYMVQQDITDHRRIWEIINQYDREPEEIINHVRRGLQEGGLHIDA
ncbi:MAG: type II/IV secretion system ATPase subunit [Euryarchaeota archaeon]|nr:type II/IV secretion system ATPase subunit [Euryarchaeota archaeon]